MFPDEILPVTVIEVLSPSPKAPNAPFSVNASNLPPSVKESVKATCGYRANPENSIASSS